MTENVTVSFGEPVSGAFLRARRFFRNFKTSSQKIVHFCLENSEKCYEPLKLFHTLIFIINSLRHDKLVSLRDEHVKVSTLNRQTKYLYKVL